MESCTLYFKTKLNGCPIILIINYAILNTSIVLYSMISFDFVYTQKVYCLYLQ